MLRKSTLIVLLGLFLTGMAFGKLQLVKLKDGREIRGEVSEQEGKYLVKTEFGPTLEFSKDQVASIQEIVDPKDEYKQRLAKIDASNADELYALAEWAAKADLLEEAKEALEAALKARPDFTRAQLKLRQVNAALAEKKGGGEEPKMPAGNGEVASTGGTIKPEWLVDEEDMIRIRRWELREDDRVVIVFANRVVERFIKKMAGRDAFREPGADKAFLAASPTTKVRYMLEWAQDDPGIRDDILVKTDPRFMIEFRSRIWPMIQQSCATSECHGGAKPKSGLKLFSIPGSNVRADYTNYILLDGYAKGSLRLIDRDHPEDSLLLQFGLPKEQAKRNHPGSIHFMYRSREDPKYTLMLEWIKNLHKAPHPEYGLKYQPPFGMKLNFRSAVDLPPREEPTTAPATGPAAKENLPI